ncbi:MAG: thymidine phosphorylase [Chloroflexi bacterium]|nr:thymidine phosphorylase [Chloroflexota bacterium]
MNPVDIIVKKRDGGELSATEISYFIEGFVKGRIPDYQAAAWAMTVYFQGMTDAETTDLTLAMAASGDQLDLHDSLPPNTIIVDKHSSGGVGDKTTLAVGAIVAACGLPVGKMSGRGLSFTGGTIDKLESIQGWSPDLSEAQFRQQLRTVGLVIAGQTAHLAPADKALYALRDVTGTVPSLPLIASSIMSKKLAAGADAIVLDVKCGHGAFMETLDEARALSKLMVAIGQRAGRRVTALITQMEQPLGRAVGHALEVKEAIATLQGQGPTDFQHLVETVAQEMLLLGQRVQTTEQAREQIHQAPVIQPVLSPRRGVVQRIDAREIGLTGVALGGGRQQKTDPIDYRVGIVLAAKVGDTVAPGEMLCTIHAANETSAEMASQRILAAYTLGDQPVAALPIIYDRITVS